MALLDRSRSTVQLDTEERRFFVSKGWTSNELNSLERGSIGLFRRAETLFDSREFRDRFPRPQEVRR